MEMKEIRLSDYKSDKKIIVSLNSNEFCFFVKSKNNENIRGFFTAGIATCSVIIISINQDDYLFFSHFHEKSNIMSEIVKTILPVIKTEKIYRLI